ncbi:MAG: hypothetical protein HDT09_05560 [Bacteroidales bacterium]|nr:hypothetical protein [Bacteroidales bacterium]
MRCTGVFFRLAAMMLVAAVCWSCDKKMTDAEASRWVSAYSSALIDKDAKVRIELTDLTMIKLDPTRSLDKIFRFSPSVKGVTRLSDDNRYLDFIPEKGFKPGKTYQCRVDLKKLTGIDSLGDFEFKFHVIARVIRFADVHTAVDPDDASMMTVRGRLEYSSAAADTLENLIVCGYPGAKIQLDKPSGSNSRPFKVFNIKRTESDKELRLSVNPMVGFSADDYKITVPSLTGFGLLSAERVEGAEPYLNLEFSTPLSSQQELDGLITVGESDNIRVERQGTNVKVYGPFQAFPTLTLHISGLLRNADGRPLDTDIERTFEQEVIAPQVKLPFIGNILPDNRNLRLPFQAVNLAAVDVEVVKIFPSNMLSFMQANNINDDGSLRRYGRLIYHKTVRLDKDKSLNLHQWQDFAIDLTGLFKQERGALYNIRLTFRKAYSLYGRAEAADFEELDGTVTEAENRIWDRASIYIYRDVPDYKLGKYNWNEANDPTKDSYYMVDYPRMPEVNLVASDLGLILKRASNNEMTVVTTNLVTATPVAGVKITAYNFQLQVVGSGVTDGNGFATFRTRGQAALITATDGVSTTYLRPNYSSELQTSNFDVGGVSSADGIKTFVYGDRGVWRPGDDIHLCVIVEDKENRLPANHPMEMKLFDPDDHLYTRKVLNGGVDGLYVFNITTAESVPTGRWKAEFYIGNEKVTYPVRIETIKPNRLKINIAAPKVLLADRPVELGLTANWLTGPVAAGLEASMEMTLYPDPNPFPAYRSYTFKNPLVTYTSSRRDLLSGVLDSVGHLAHSCIIGGDRDSPGMLTANITAKVNETGGDMSFISKSVPFAPFGVYVGVDLGKGEFVTDTDIHFPVVVLNQLGARMKNRELSYKIYRLNWTWWWEGDADDLSRYVKSTTAEEVASGTVTATNGVADIPFKVEYPTWGRYLVLVRDLKGGHATGGVVSVDWPEWRGRSDKTEGSGSRELDFNLDKDRYQVGETANVYLPQCPGGRVLLSIENATGILRKVWVPLSGTSATKYPLYIDKKMAPNFYVSATMLRPHSATDFNTPIRLFGVRGAKVVDEQTILHPVIDMPEELHPQKQFTVKVSERDRKPMTYTLAIVDEGLLDISGFRTPNPWRMMNQKEALGVTTWDMYDEVIGAFGGSFRSIHRVGGDEALRKSAGAEKRFKPAVMFLGPFTTAGTPKVHKLTMPGYVGSVRVMIVAAHKGTYGSADKTVKVKAPLMLLTTLPRSLANCDSVDMPVNVFSMEDGVKDVALKVEVDGPVKIAGSNSRTLSFNGAGEKPVTFRLECDPHRQGRARIIVSASGAGQVAKDTTFINLHNPMPEMIETQKRTLPAGAVADFKAAAREGETLSLQVSAFPMLNFKAIDRFFYSYPHLCTEQISSKAMFALYADRFLDADACERSRKALPLTISQLQERRSASGGYVYWPGQKVENEWVTSMAGVVLAEASHQGFRIDKDSFEKWIAFQQKQARDYKYAPSTDLIQAYRLYSLAVAGHGLTSAMNRLRESKSLSKCAAYCLAAAYMEMGRKDVALKLIERAERSVAVPSDDMFESDLRNNAIALEVYAACGESAKALELARDLAAGCATDGFVTQDVAFTAVAMEQLARLTGTSKIDVKITEKDRMPSTISRTTDVLDVAVSGPVSVENLNAAGSLELSLLSARKPAANESVRASENGVKITVNYTDLNGHPVAPASLKQNTEFKAVIMVTNQGRHINNAALTYAIPTGWEIWNDLFNREEILGCANADIRDESAKFYFSLKEGEGATYEVRLRAAYIGNYLLPPAVVEDMYNPVCRANTAGARVEVTKR